MRLTTTGYAIALLAFAGCASSPQELPHPDAEVIGYTWIVEHDRYHFYYTHEGELYPTYERAKRALEEHLRRHYDPYASSRVVTVYERPNES